MPLYISIPAGYEFVQRSDANGIKKDCLFNSESERIINLQEIVKNAIRTNRKNNNKIVTPEFTIHLKTPPDTDERFLVYAPNNNGKDPTEIEPRVITGKEGQKFNPAALSSYGNFWNQQTTLAPEKEAEVGRKRKAQKENRRHVGDSPKAT